MNLAGQARFWQSLRVNFKLVGWWPAALSAAILSVFLVLERSADPGNPVEAMYLKRAIETIVPMLFAVQAAFLLGPDNEPALELLSSYPRSLPRLLLDRLILVAGMHFLLALAATLIFWVLWGPENLGLALLRWLTAGIALGGLALFTTQLTRQGVFGTLMVTLLWASSLYGGDEILKVWRWFWPFHIYLQPEKLGLDTYLLNRLILVLAGLSLGLAAVRFLEDGDRLLDTR